MNRAVLALLITLFIPWPSEQAAQTPQSYGMTYRLGMSRPASHLFEVRIDVRIPAADRSPYIDLQIPRWQPGRYAVADFAKNIQEFSASGDNQPLSWTKIDDQTWRVQRQGRMDITAVYKVFGNDLSGTYAQLDVGHASYTGGELFMYIVGHKADPVELRVEPPPTWRVINGRTETPGQLAWKYPNYETMIDNPTEVGPDWTLDQFSVNGKTYRVVVHSRGNEAGRRPALVHDLERIVRAELSMWGIPEFDNYTFLFHFSADDRSSDGMEHLTSTHIIEPGVLAETGSYNAAVRTAAHEFFHAWNVKRLRPAELGPWDWTKPAATRALWIAEGFTEYYGVSMFYRAGFSDSSEFVSSLSDTVTAVENTPGSRLMSAEASSMAAPFLDAALHRQKTNLSNTSVSYYLKGELIALTLDLIIRGRTKGQRSLDDVMRHAYDQFYLKSANSSYYLKGRGYTIEEFANIVSEIAGTNMDGFFARYVRGTETLPYDEALGYVGLRLKKSPGYLPYTGGIVIDPDDHVSLRLGALPAQSPAERGGLQEGDALLAIGGTPVSRQNWQSLLNHYKQEQGNRVPISVRRFRKTLELSIQLAEPDVFDYHIEIDPNASFAAKQLRNAWLSAK
jgi:predicted metalloprotease with PDZ domain